MIVLWLAYDYDEYKIDFTFIGPRSDHSLCLSVAEYAEFAEYAEYAQHAEYAEYVEYSECRI